MTREEHTEKINDIIKGNRLIKAKLDSQNNKLSQIRDYTPKDVDEAYQRGLDDAWECARKIADGALWDEYLKMHGSACAINVLNAYSAQKAIAKIAEYEKQKNVIKIGDELEQITNSGNPTGVFCIVTNIRDDKFNGITEDGKAVVCSSQIYRWWRKTGRTFPQIEEVLKAMQEGTES